MTLAARMASLIGISLLVGLVPLPTATTGAEGISLWESLPLYAAYSVGILAESFFRGIFDGARAVVPVLLYGQNKDELDVFNAQFQMMWEFGGLLGPLLCGLMLSVTEFKYANLVVPIIYFFGLLCLLKVPDLPKVPTSSSNDRIGALRYVWQVNSSAAVWIPTAGFALLQTWRLKVSVV